MPMPRLNPSTRVFPSYGPRRSGLRKPSRVHLTRRFLRHQSKIKFQISAHLLASNRQKYRSKMRPVNQVDWILFIPEISRSTPQNQVSRFFDWEETCFSYQQFFIAGTNNSGAVSLPLADRNLFQMDQATPAHQIVFRDH